MDKYQTQLVETLNSNNTHTHPKPSALRKILSKVVNSISMGNSLVWGPKLIKQHSIKLNKNLGPNHYDTKYEINGPIFV